MKIYCRCGCGSLVVTPGAKWVKGHHMRSRKNRMRSHRWASTGLQRPENSGSGWNKGLTKADHPSLQSVSDKMSGRKQTKKHTARIVAIRKKNGSYQVTQLQRDLASERMKRVWRQRKRGVRPVPKMSKGRGKRTAWGQWHWMGKKNKAEAVLEHILDSSFPGQFVYTGDKQVCIGGRFPDFTNVNGRKEVIELFGSTVHGPEFTGRRRSDESRQKKLHYKKWGFRCVVIWSSQLGQEDKVVDKINRQLGRI